MMVIKTLISSDFSDRSDFFNEVFKNNSTKNNNYSIKSMFYDSYLGRGSSGTVAIYLTPTNELAVVKNSVNESQNKYIKREHMHLEYLYNEGCTCSPKPYFGTDSYITMEYLGEFTLENFLITRRPSSDTRKKIVNSIIANVLEIHKLGVYHCDIKPSNIMVSSKDNTTKLIDFAFSSKKRKKGSKFYAGSPEYMSFENLGNWLMKLKKDNSISSENIDVVYSDIYSLGAVILRVLYDIRPFINIDGLKNSLEKKEDIYNLKKDELYLENFLNSNIKDRNIVTLFKNIFGPQNSRPSLEYIQSEFNKVKIS